jgi:histidine triad (HIT) family protein
MSDCLFCSIANGDGSKLVWQDDAVAAFDDINPKAPVHILVVPKQHLSNLDDLSDADLAGRLLLAVRSVAHEAGLKGGYRIKVNNGKSVGQVVDHLHFHVLGGRDWQD